MADETGNGTNGRVKMAVLAAELAHAVADLKTAIGRLDALCQAQERDRAMLIQLTAQMGTKVSAEDFETFKGEVWTEMGRVKERQSVLAVAQGLRRAGSAALDLAYLAAGRLDGFFEENLKPWDTAAGVLLVAESGGRITTFAGGDYNLDSENILASNGLLHAELMDCLAPDQGAQ